MAFELFDLKTLVTPSQLSFLTGVRLSRITDYLSGKVIPRETTLRGFQNLYYRINYGRGRSEGLSTREAKRFARLKPDKISEKLSILKETVKNIAKNAGTDESAIRDSMRHSEKSFEELIDLSPKKKHGR